MSEQQHSRQSPVGLLTAFVLLAGCFVVMFGIIVLDNAKSTGELLILIGVVLVVLGGAGLGMYVHSVRPGQD